MGTRSITLFREEYQLNDGTNNVEYVACMYRQMDGGLNCHAKSLVEFLNSADLVNGIGGRSKAIFNGMGCLAAQAVMDFKADAGPGGIYLYPIPPKLTRKIRSPLRYRGSFGVGVYGGAEWVYVVNDYRGKLELWIIAPSCRPRVADVLVYAGSSADVNFEELVDRWNRLDEDPESVRFIDPPLSRVRFNPKHFIKQLVDA